MGAHHEYLTDALIIRKYPCRNGRINVVAQVKTVLCCRRSEKFYAVRDHRCDG